MSDKSDDKEKKTLSLSNKPQVKKAIDGGQIRQSFSHGRSKTVSVEVKKKRTFERGGKRSDSQPQTKEEALKKKLGLTDAEWDLRMKAIQQAKAAAFSTARDEELAKLAAADKKRQEEIEAQKAEAEQREKNIQEAELKKKAEEKELQRKIEAEKAAIKAEKNAKKASKEKAAAKPAAPSKSSSAPTPQISIPGDEQQDHQKTKQKKIGAPQESSDNNDARANASRKTLSVNKRSKSKQKLHQLSYEAAMSGSAEEKRERSLASIQRARQKKKAQAQEPLEQKQIVREVIIPDVITVQELSNRMATRGAEVIKKLMSMGIMATLNQNLDADTAEIIVEEFGHTTKRVSESDVELGLNNQEDSPESLLPRAPVVTVMGHVDHGKTSLLDAIRKSHVVSSEAGGITQHIGAYQVQSSDGSAITFIDTPGHAAFSEMRARGADVTDIVVLVVAADDGVKEQTVEAINHAKAANVPIIVAINKMDKPDATPDRVKSDLLMHEIVAEDMGGDVLFVEISAKTGLNIDKLKDTILLQSEILELKANPNRSASGVVVESKVDLGRGPVATVLIQRGTLKVGDIFVASTEWGRVRALVSPTGDNVKEALPSEPVEVLGASGAPAPGQDFSVVENEAQAREIVEYRVNKQKNKQVTLMKEASFEQLLKKSAESDHNVLSVVVKADVQGSVEALVSSFHKFENDEVRVQILHTGVGGINESDVMLAQASQGLIIGFNVRANPQARDLAAKENTEIRYYSVIYDAIDDVKTILSGLLAPELKERFLGYAQIREVFNITKAGKIAGCYITEGTVKRGAKVRLLRDNVVIHTGALKTLKRFKDEVKEVKEGYECGMAFENYQDIRENDVIECYEIEEIAREL